MNPYRLSASSKPTRYEITIRPDLSMLTFSGSEKVYIDLLAPTQTIELNSSDLTIAEAHIEIDHQHHDVVVEMDVEHEIVRFRLSSELPPSSLVLHISFQGKLSDNLAGFYHSSYSDESGVNSILATTQFEATDARRAFPCFDEPDKKAVFSITIEANPQYLVISNYPTMQVEMIKEGALNRIRFQDTMAMSTYLVAWVIGVLEITNATEALGVPIRVAHVPGKGHLTSFAHKVAEHAVAFFTEWFSIPYPAPKLDLIAIPDFAFGAMENLGAVTFREQALLIDEDSASQLELQRVADVICHEIAHMWFGDLVTMKWWNGIWLNEAFATYMEVAASDAFRPQWRKWESFGIDRVGALAIDGLPSTRAIEYKVVAPSDSNNMFDMLTYEKGGSVLRMLEQHLGIENFQRGVKLYLERHLYANAETTDLWDAIEEATSQPVRAMMDSWVFQGGHPVVDVETTPTGIQLTQRPFRYLHHSGDPKGAIGSRWSIPITLKTPSSEHKLVLSEESTSLVLREEPGPIIVNAHGSGVFRVRYGEALHSGLLAHYHELENLERFNLLSDSWALTLAGEERLSRYASLLVKIVPELNPNVLRIASSALSLMMRIATDGEKGRVAALARQLFHPVIKTLGYEPIGTEDEGNQVARAVALEALGTTGEDQEARDVCEQLFRHEMAGESDMPGDLASAVLATVAAQGDETAFAFVLDRYRHPKNPQDESRHLYALADFQHSSLASRVAEMALGEVRSQNAAFLLARLLANPVAGEVAFSFITTHFSELLNKLPANSHSRMLETLSLLCTPITSSLSDEVFAFFEANPLRAGEMLLAQTLERYRVNLRFSQKYSGRLLGELP